ncbi:MAG: DNA mismatch repair endonuclease MutL [Saprospiraceae bacterium]
MADVIQLLPDSIANQIAAGEVIQRPASMVKELLENAIDAGSTSIKLIVKEAGKTLVQVIDNGCGMSETDARMCFERHATSKIRESKDLFAIRTMGFRGEALASIAAVAQVEMRTRRQIDELGTRIVIEGSELKTQEACQCITGTNLSIKNLFFNVPVRRRFLKSNTVEMRHIMDEFQRIAIANPDIFFSLHHNNSEVFHLPAGNLRQRLVGIWGTNANKKLVPVSEETDVIKIQGYIGKPQFSKRTRGEQLFFVNNRFIKSGYLNHAVMAAYEDLLQKDTYPLYAIFIEMDPDRIDINVHPTKQEIKFDDERLVYNYLKVAVRHALGQNSITPMLDFDREVGLYQPTLASSSGSRVNQNQVSPNQGPTSSNNYTPTPSSDAGDNRDANNLKNWRKLYDGLEMFDEDGEEAATDEDGNPSEAITIKSKWSTAPELDDSEKSFSSNQRTPYQIHARYIVSHIKSGYILIDQQAAHERILFEQYLFMLKDQQAPTQKELFPKPVQVSPLQAPLLREILPQINLLGIDIHEIAGGQFVIHGMPADWRGTTDEQKLVETLLQQYESNIDLDLGVDEKIARSMARSAALKRGQSLTIPEMKELIDQLFACKTPFKSPFGRNCFITYELDELDNLFSS